MTTLIRALSLQAQRGDLDAVVALRGLCRRGVAEACVALVVVNQAPLLAAYA